MKQTTALTTRPLAGNKQLMRFAYLQPERFLMIRPVLILLTLLFSSPVLAEPAAAPKPAAEQSGVGVSGLPIPRFVSITAARVNLRMGPGRQYPISWILQRRHLPVEIVEEFEHWRKIRERSGEVGWVHKTMLSGKRMGMVITSGKTGELTPAYAKAEVGKPVLMAEAGAIGEISQCQGDWCAIKFQKAEGWMCRDNLWGTYPAEEFEE